MVGKLIVFEGIDGSGKTEMVNRTVRYLFGQLGFDNVRESKDLGGSALGEELRRTMYTVAPPRTLGPGVLDLLFLAGHVQNWTMLVGPWLQEGKVVVSDRWWLSQFAYTAGRPFHPDVQELYAKMKGAWPDLTIFLYGDPHKLLARANARSDSGTHQSQKAWNDPAVQLIVAQRYSDLYAGRPGWWPICVDDRDVDQVWTEVQHAVDHLLEVHARA